MENENNFIPFDEFKAILKNKKEILKIQSSVNPELSRVKTEIIRKYLVNYYSRIYAVSSYVDDDGQIWDCIPIEQQPGLKGNRKDSRYLNPPQNPVLLDLPPKDPFNKNIISKDVHGNSMNCPENCIPLRRLNLKTFFEFGDLELVFQKGSFEGYQYKNIIDSKHALRDEPNRRYAYSQQKVFARGISCFLNIWQPRVLRPHQVFSLSQIWMTAGHHGTFQSIEAGWIVYPDLFQTEKPVLFVYYTPNGYEKGSYNTDRPETFILVNSPYSLGRALPYISQHMGPQYEIRMDWVLENFAWWLYIEGVRVGYYPTKLFKGGQLSKMADTILVGGEVLGHRTWGPMGSGVFAKFGFQQAAYIRNINYFAPDGSINPMIQTPMTPSPNCYRHEVGTDPRWQSSFYFGGPGGNNCL